MLIRPESTEIQTATATVLSFIESGGYKPGDRLPSEKDLIVRLDMARSALRKALETLEREGRIWRHVGKGTFVAAHGGQDSEGVLGKLSLQVSPVHLMRARLSLEPPIAREAAISATDAAVTRIKLARDRAAHALTWDDYEEQDDLFHRSVAEATGNALLLSLFEHLNQVRRAVAWNTVVRDTPRPPRDHSSFAEHSAIIAAIEARDPVGAHAAMRKHLGSVSARLFGEI